MKKLTKVLAMVLVFTFVITLLPVSTEAATKKIKTSGKGMDKYSIIKKTGTYSVTFTGPADEDRVSPECIRFVAPKTGKYRITFSELYIEECDADTYEGMCFGQFGIINGTKLFKKFDREDLVGYYDPQEFGWKQNKKDFAKLYAVGYKRFNEECYGAKIPEQYTKLSCSKTMKKGECLYFLTWGAEDRTLRDNAPTATDARSTHVTVKIEKIK